MKTALTNEQIISLAGLVASDLGMRGFDEEELVSSLERNPAMPTILSDSSSQLWVDRHYVAHSSLQEEFVHYVYIASDHAREELRDLSCDSAKAKDVDTVNDIIRQLKRASETERPFYLRPTYRRRMERASILEI